MYETQHNLNLMDTEILFSAILFLNPILFIDFFIYYSLFCFVFLSFKNYFFSFSVLKSRQEIINFETTFFYRESEITPLHF